MLIISQQYEGTIPQDWSPLSIYCRFHHSISQALCCLEGSMPQDISFSFYHGLDGLNGFEPIEPLELLEPLSVP